MIKAQELINHDKKIKFFKTHNFLGLWEDINLQIKNTWGIIYIKRSKKCNLE